MKETKPVKERRKYNGAFKREAVEHWLKSGKSAEVIGQELGIEAERLYAWRQRFRPPTEAEAVDLKAQLEATRLELARVTEQRDILKKTLGIISEPPPKNTSGSKP
jgi:transposase-like protein